MKKILAIVLLAAMALSLCACGPVNEKTVAVLWADGDKAVSPNSLINAMDRAMYIENVGYTYYGAQGDAAKQLAQAQEALAADCGVLMVELIDEAAAADFVELAKAAAVPVVFFNCDVEASVSASYDKCVVVNTDKETLAEKYSEMVSEYLKENAEDMDRNGDGKISYIYLYEGELATDVKDLEVELEMLDTTEIDPNVVEMILSDDDAEAQQLLVALQAKDYNTDKLVTQSVVIFTVGNEADYKALVLDGAPQEEAARKAHFEENKYLVDLSLVAQEDLEEMIYTTTNVIGDGRIAGTAMEDYDAIAVAAAEACAALATDKPVENTVVAVAYTTYTG